MRRSTYHLHRAYRPPLYRAGLRVQLMYARFSRAMREIFLGERNSLVRAIVAERMAPRALEPVVLDKFEYRYQDLIDLLCISAKDGLNQERSGKYMELRDWFGRNYGVYRSILIPYLSLANEEPDPFEAIFMHQSLKTAINSDELIAHVQRTRIALEKCRAQAERMPV